MQPIRAVTVYCSSSRYVDRVYFDAAAELGTAVARAGWRLVYGGNRIGCMGALADAARAAGGRVTGITPRLLVDQGIADEQCDELVVTNSMRERKALLEERGDAFIAMPGGLGTLEELLEILVGRILGYHAKPIVILNAVNYYGPLLSMIEHGIDGRFINRRVQTEYCVTQDVAQTIAILKRHGPAAPILDAAVEANGSAAE
jgi:uncharacterized protein (TIGR00730 family)